MAFPSRGLSLFSRTVLILSSRTYCAAQQAVVLSTSQTNRRRYRLTFDLRGLFLLSKIIFNRALVRSRSHVRLPDWIQNWRVLSYDGKPDQPIRHDGDRQLRSSGGGGDDGSRRRPLKLMDYQELMWPHPIKSIRNYVFAALIRGYYDSQFSMSSFLKGAEQAVATVSGLISKGQFESLEGLVANDAIWELRRSYDSLSPQQRQFVAADPTDFFFRFIYEIGMIFDDDTDQRFVEITTVFQGFHGLENVKRNNAGHYTEEMYRSRDQVYICNYRFIREFTKGKEDEWTINKLNHFCPTELEIREE
jgi:hypothetical protein